MIQISPRRVVTIRRFPGRARMPLASSTMSSGTGSGVRAQYFSSRATRSPHGFAKRSAEDGLLTCAPSDAAPARKRKVWREKRFIAASPDDRVVDRRIEGGFADADHELLFPAARMHDRRVRG